MDELPVNTERNVWKREEPARDKAIKIFLNPTTKFKIYYIFKWFCSFGFFIFRFQTTLLKNSKTNA